MHIRTFSTSGLLMQRPNHILYKSIDWSRVDAGNFACVDPVDPHAILYLSEKEYKVQMRVSLSQDITLVILARPGDTPVSQSQTSSSKSDSDAKPPKTPPTHVQFGTQGKSSFWKRFLNFHLSNLRALAKGSSVRTKRQSRQDASVSVELSSIVLKTLIPYWGLDLNFRLGGELTPPRALVQDLRVFANSLARILESSGPNFLIQKMKNTLFVLNKYLAGTRATDPFLLEPPVGLSNNGIPALIPLGLRRLIGKNHTPTIRMVVSLLNAFRAFEGSHKPQGLETILGAHPELDDQVLTEFQIFCKEEFWPKIVGEQLPLQLRKSMIHPEMEFRIGEYDKIYSPLNAGPNGPCGLLAGPIDAYAWSVVPEGKDHLRRWCLHIGDSRTLQLRDSCLALLDEETLSDMRYNAYGDHRGAVHLRTDLGRLGLIPEPAGKVRVVAIVDYWTQRVMSPVHTWMMKILSHLQTDGTFDQEGALRSFARMASYCPEKDLYSIDLKSATDMIPIALYRAVFEAVWHGPTVDLWIDLLTDRWFQVPNDKLVVKNLRGAYIKYARGQPMGTLSSWPSMAIVHHALTQFAAARAREFSLDGYRLYRVLGDDNVTAGADIAKSYVEVAKALCVPTSPAKTLDGKLFIFAQQIYLRHGEGFLNLSPISLKEELGINSFGQRLEVALRAIRRGWIDERPNLYRFLRLLLSRADYIRSVKDWSSGLLGRVAQAALISAFGVTGPKIFKGLSTHLTSGIEPFLRAMLGSITALAGDQGPPVMSESKLSFNEFERLLAVRVAGQLERKIRSELEAARIYMIRFHMWNESILETGFLPLGFKVRKGPLEPGLAISPFTCDGGSKAIIELAKKGDIPGMAAENGKFPVSFRLPVTGMEFSYDQLFDSYISAYHKSLWLIIKDHYQPIFGYFDKDGHPEYSDFESEEDGGMGMTLSDDPGETVSPSGRSTRTPTLVVELEIVHTRVKEIMESLLREEELPAPWGELEKLAEIAQSLVRLPDFTSLGCFKRAAVKPDELTSFMRKARLLLSSMDCFIQGEGSFISVREYGGDSPAASRQEMSLDEALLRLEAMAEFLAPTQNKQGLFTG
nr:RNA-dependent RNA polymerase [Rhizophagus clarus mitovirus 4]